MAHKLLIIEDDERLREIICDYFAAKGFALYEAADGTAALEALESAEYDLVFLDRMRARAYAVVERLNDLMTGTGAYVEPPLTQAQIHDQLGNIVREAASEGVYLRAGIYDGKNNLIAKTGNTLIVGKEVTDDEGNPVSPWRENFVVLLDEYMKVADINECFAPKNLWNSQYVAVIGSDDGQRITPSKLELYTYWDTFRSTIAAIGLATPSGFEAARL